MPWDQTERERETNEEKMFAVVVMVKVSQWNVVMTDWHVLPVGPVGRRLVVHHTVLPVTRRSPVTQRPTPAVAAVVTRSRSVYWSVGSRWGPATPASMTDSSMSTKSTARWPSTSPGAVKTDTPSSALKSMYFVVSVMLCLKLTQRKGRQISDPFFCKFRSPCHMNMPKFRDDRPSDLGG